MMSWSCPFHAIQPPLHVPDIFSVCPLHLPCMSRSFVASHFPTSPVVLGFLVLCFLSFPLHSPCFHFCPLHVPFSSPLFPFHVPLLSCHVDFLFPPLISLALPCISPLLPNISSKKNTGFPAFSQLGRPKTQSFPDFLQKEAGTPNQQRAGRGIEPGTPVLPAPRRLRLVERHQIAARSLGGGGAPPPTYQTSGGGGVRGGVILYPLLGVRHAEQCRRIYIYIYTLYLCICIYLHIFTFTHMCNECYQRGPCGHVRKMKVALEEVGMPCLTLQGSVFERRRVIRQFHAQGQGALDPAEFYGSRF